MRCRRGSGSFTERAETIVITAPSSATVSGCPVALVSRNRTSSDVAQRAGRADGHPQPQQPGIGADRPVTRPPVPRGCVTEHPWPASLPRNACLLPPTLAQRPRWDAMSTRTTLADGRELLFFSLPGSTPSPVADRRPLPPFEPGQSQLRFDQATGQWVIIAARRQDRTYKPPPDQCPLCPGPTGLTSEVPAPDYDVVVFENRFPSLSGSGSRASVPDGFVPSPGVGRCEVICFSSDHTGSFAELPLPHARLVVDAWRDRTAALLGLPGVQQVFCFENRGEEIGVTLAHPHGQIYGYSFLTPRTAAMMEQAR